MTDPLTYLRAAHKRAEEVARAIADDLWWADHANRIEVYNDAGALIAGADDTVRTLLAANDPAAVLHRITKEREILATWEDPDKVRHLPEGAHDGRDPDETEAQVAAAEAIDGVVRLLAEAWGWQDAS